MLEVAARGQVSAAASPRGHRRSEGVLRPAVRPPFVRAVLAEAIEATVREANTSIIAQHGFKLAMDPKVVMPQGEGEMAEMMAGKSDLAYSVELEILPQIELGDFKDIRLERLTADVTD